MTPNATTFDTHIVFDPRLYLRFYLRALTAERSDREAAQILELLRPERPLRILDLPTGFGRHANRLAAHGHQVTGMDLTPEFLAMARRDAAGLAQPPTYMEGDMAKLDVAGAYDVVLNLFSSFGYHDDATCADIIRRFARALVPGGRLMLEIISLTGLLERWNGVSVHESGDDVMIDQVIYDPVSGRTGCARTTIIDGQRQTGNFFVRHFTPPEFTRMCRDAGLVIERWCDGFSGRPYERTSRRLLFIARKE
jgi:SAM-dependent methyltransferase